MARKRLTFPGVLIYAVLILVFASSREVYGTETITMAFFESPAQSPVFRFAELVYTEAFKRIGKEFKYKIYPPLRASSMLNSGEVDAEPSRIRSYGDIYENIIRVDEPVTEMKIIAVTNDSDIAFEGWDDLNETHYRVEYFRGIALAEQRLKDIIQPGNLSSASKETQALNKLLAGRIDVFVDSELRLRPLLESSEYQDTGIRVAGVLEDASTFPYLHKRHADLAPKLAETLKQMKVEGLFDQYFWQAREEFAER